MSIQRHVFESNIPPAKQESGPAPTPQGAKCGLVENGLLTLISQSSE